MPIADADLVARLLVKAELRGYAGHGVTRVSQYLEFINNKTYDLSSKPEIEREGKVTAVIDAKHYKGRVEQRNVGKWLSTDIRLFVGGRDRTQLLDGLVRQRATIDHALEGTDVTDVPVHTVLCFVGGDWKLFAKPFALRSSLVTWPNALYERIIAGEPVGTCRQRELLAAFERKLPPCA